MADDSGAMDLIFNRIELVAKKNMIFDGMKEK